MIIKAVKTVFKAIGSAIFVSGAGVLVSATAGHFGASENVVNMVIGVSSVAALAAMVGVLVAPVIMAIAGKTANARATTMASGKRNASATSSDEVGNSGMWIDQRAKSRFPFLGFETSCTAMDKSFVDID